MLLDDLVTYIANAGLGTPGTDLFAGSRTVHAPVKCITLAEYNGTPPARTSAGIVSENPRVQVRIRDKEYPDARNTAEALYKLLDGVANTTIGTTRYQFIEALAPPALLGADESGNTEIVINLAIKKGLSA